MYKSSLQFGRVGKLNCKGLGALSSAGKEGAEGSWAVGYGGAERVLVVARVLWECLGRFGAQRPKSACLSHLDKDLLQKENEGTPYYGQKFETDLAWHKGKINGPPAARR